MNPLAISSEWDSRYQSPICTQSHYESKLKVHLLLSTENFFCPKMSDLVTIWDLVDYNAGAEEICFGSLHSRRQKGLTDALKQVTSSPLSGTTSMSRGEQIMEDDHLCRSPWRKCSGTMH